MSDANALTRRRIDAKLTDTTSATALGLMQRHVGTMPQINGILFLTRHETENAGAHGRSLHEFAHSVRCTSA